MSRNEENTGKAADMDFSALDTELARMAEETPDVPADFHAGWTKAIREEAAARQNGEAHPEEDKTEQRKSEARRQRRYILSAAAAFVLVIGGYMAIRTYLSNPFTLENPPEKQVVQEQAAPPGIPDAGTEEQAVLSVTEQTEKEPQALASGAEETGASADSAAGSAGEASGKPASGRSDAEEWRKEEAALPVEILQSDNAAAPYEADTMTAEEYVYIQPEDAAERNNDWTAAAEEENDSAAEAEEYQAAEESAGGYPVMKLEAAAVPAQTSAPTPKPTLLPTPEPKPAPTEEPTPVPTEEPTSAPTEEPTSVPADKAGTAGNMQSGAKQSGKAAAAKAKTENQEAGAAPSFLQRVWNFILKVTPYALAAIGVILFLVTYLIRARQRRKNDRKKGGPD